jgi:uncharacterized protein (DUF342 family)
MKFTIFYFDPKITKIFAEKQDEKGEKYFALSTPYNFFYRDEIMARVVSVEEGNDPAGSVDKDQPYFNIEKYTALKAGDGVFYDQMSGCYKAQEYGFGFIDAKNARLKILNPLQLSKDRSVAYYVIFPTKFSAIPTYKDIEDLLQKNRIITILDKSKIEEALASIDPKVHKIHRIIVAQGRKPVNGYNEYMIPLLSLDKKAGKVIEGGRMDFKEVGSVIDVTKDQRVLQRIPGLKSENGYDIYGETIEATLEAKEGFLKGDNLTPSQEDGDIFISSINGCLLVEGKKISIYPYAVIKGDVDYDSGNVDFHGSVLVRGSVLPGFSVKAKGDIIVESLVDDAVLDAEGDITVKGGITGKGSAMVIAGGSLKTKYLLNATVETSGEIVVQDSIINSKVFSNERITVTGGHGIILGGEVTARHEIVVNTVGKPNETTHTNLTVGKSLTIEREILELRKKMEKFRKGADEIMLKIRTSFGESLFEDPKKFIAMLPPVKKKSCITLLQELSNCNKDLKVLTDQCREAEALLKLEKEPVIIVTDTIYPGSILTIKKNKKDIFDKLQNVKFFEDPELKIIKFTSAV